MKKILFLLLFCLCFTTLNSQIPTVVNDPLNAKINGAIEALQITSTSLQRFLSNTKLLELSTTGLAQLKSIEEILKLVDDLACLTQEFRLYLNIGTQYNCIKFINYRLVDINLSYTTEILTTVLIAKNIFTMKAEGRINIMTSVKEILEATAKDMQIMIASIHGNLLQKSYDTYVKKQLKSTRMRSMAFNRYNSK